jgi:hypothetical protein
MNDDDARKRSLENFMKLILLVARKYGLKSVEPRRTGFSNFRWQRVVDR